MAAAAPILEYKVRYLCSGERLLVRRICTAVGVAAYSTSLPTSGA